MFSWNARKHKQGSTDSKTEAGAFAIVTGFCSEVGKRLAAHIVDNWSVIQQASSSLDPSAACRLMLEKIREQQRQEAARRAGTPPASEPNRKPR